MKLPIGVSIEKTEIKNETAVVTVKIVKALIPLIVINLAIGEALEIAKAWLDDIFCLVGGWSPYSKYLVILYKNEDVSMLCVSASVRLGIAKLYKRKKEDVHVIKNNRLVLYTVFGAKVYIRPESPQEAIDYWTKKGLKIWQKQAQKTQSF